MNKKGFTLIELLAVIVILAIIALIATPVILGVVENARKGAAKSSALGYIDAVEKQIAINLLDNDNTTDIKDGVYEIADLDAKNVKVKGEKPSEGWVQIEKGQVSNYSLKVNKYYTNPTDGNIGKVSASKTGEIATKPAGGNSTSTVKTYTVGEAINYDPETNALCESPVSTTGTKTGCMKWYVIKDNGSSVDVILDHNTTAKVAYETSGTYKEYEQASIKTQVDTDTTGWTAGLKPRLITANEIASITNTTTFDGSSSTRFYLNGSGDKKQTQVSTSQGTNEYAWLFDYTKDCTNYGCTTADNSTYGYWTSSPVSDYSIFAWSVYSNGDLNFLGVDNVTYYGVRPVITISKNVIK